MPATSPRIVVLTRDHAPHVKQAWEQLQPALAPFSGVQVITVEYGEELDFTKLEADLVVVLGGDGTILRTCRQMALRQLPILGVNVGRLGFLADLSPQEFVAHLPDLARGDYRIVKHLMYECTLFQTDGPSETHLGLNEVAVSAGAAFRLIDVELAIDNEPVTTYSGDGLIVSTPIGSTAHSLSAGGPILRQDLQAFVITPICPHTLTIRPVVDRADRIYSLGVPNIPSGVTLVIDGQIQLSLKSGDRIEVRRASVCFQLAKVRGHSDYGTLHRKLGWTGQPRYRLP
jgi:NAD+ kinase